MARPSRPISAIVALLASSLTLGLASGPAHAQIGESTGLVDVLFPEYMNRDVVIFVDGLGLDDTQRVIIEALFEDYIDGFDDAKEDMEAAFNNMQESIQGNPDKASVVRTALQPLKTLISSKAELAAQLFNGVQVVLTEEQLEQWPSFLRRLTREKTMSKGRIEGESIDLFHVLRDVRAPESLMRALEPPLLDYEIDLDTALQARNALFQRAQLDLLDSISDQGQVTDTSAAIRQVHLRVAIRDINDTHREIIAEQMGEEFGPIFRRLALERAYPTIFQRTMFEKVLAGALEMQDLSADTRDAVMSIQHGYLNELDGLSYALLAQRRQSEPRELLDRIEAFQARMAGDSPKKSAQRERNNLYKRDEIARPYLVTLQATLSEEQFAALPQASRMLERQQRLDRMRQMEENARTQRSEKMESGLTTLQTNEKSEGGDPPDRNHP